MFTLNAAALNNTASDYILFAYPDSIDLGNTAGGDGFYSFLGHFVDSDGGQNVDPNEDAADRPAGFNVYRIGGFTGANVQLTLRDF